MIREKILIKGNIVFPGEVFPRPGLLEIADGVISHTGERGSSVPGAGYRVYNFGDSYVCPGFIDMHVHGAGGADVMDSTPESLSLMARVLAEGGTTAFLGTTMSAPRQELVQAVANAAAVMLKETGGARLIGIHLEGPFLNPEKKGAHIGANLRPPGIAELNEYIEAGGGMVRMMTIAPELPGAIEVIRYAVSLGMVVSLGHSAATITQVHEAYAAGLSHVTHAFNAMGAFHHRDPGTIGAILSMRELTVDIIPDGFHVHPAVIKALVLAKGTDRVAAISDCSRAGQMTDGIYELGGQKVTMKDGVVRLADGTLSGSTISMAGGVKVLVEEVGLSIGEAIQMASANPAVFLGLRSKGTLAPGKDADITVLDRNYRVLMTMVGGKIVVSG